MCLILFAHNMHPHYRLILAANRDEYYARATLPVQFWHENLDILAGKDQVSGGTWLGVNRRGDWAAITNFRNQEELQESDNRSRGLLVHDYLERDKEPFDFLSDLSAVGDQYNGYNLLVSNDHSIGYMSNRGAPAQELTPGYYGLSNHLLDTPWPKLKESKVEFVKSMETGLLNESALFDLLADISVAKDDQLPETGFGLKWERVLSPRFIQSELYGTRSSSLLLIDREGWVTFVERSFNRSPDDWQEVRVLFKSKSRS